MQLLFAQGPVSAQACDIKARTDTPTQRLFPNNMGLGNHLVDFSTKSSQINKGFIFVPLRDGAGWLQPTAGCQSRLLPLRSGPCALQAAGHRCP